MEKSNRLTFEQWVVYVFDHPVKTDGQEWYWEAETNWWDGTAAEKVRFLTAAFQNAATILQPYSDAQLNQGLWYIADNACSNYMFALLDTAIPWPERQRCISSIYTLFGGCLAKRCTPHLSHLDEPGASPLNLVCYMWWDIAPLVGQPKDPSRTVLDREILNVMDATLQLDSLACQESALHGLGHWYSYYPEPVTEIIDRYMKAAAVNEKLRAYALSARQGCVL